MASAARQGGSPLQPASPTKRCALACPLIPHSALNRRHHGRLHDDFHDLQEPPQVQQIPGDLDPANCPQDVGAHDRSRAPKGIDGEREVDHSAGKEGKQQQRIQRLLRFRARCSPTEDIAEPEEDVGELREVGNAQDRPQRHGLLARFRPEYRCQVGKSLDEVVSQAACPQVRLPAEHAALHQYQQNVCEEEADRAAEHAHDGTVVLDQAAWQGDDVLAMRFQREDAANGDARGVDRMREVDDVFGGLRVAAGRQVDNAEGHRADDTPLENAHAAPGDTALLMQGGGLAAIAVASVCRPVLRRGRCHRNASGRGTNRGGRRHGARVRRLLHRLRHRRGLADCLGGRHSFVPQLALLRRHG
mmetsp:Transcript_30416/g.88197  ORF Transcript_30416/g.88197 Transcript_30416/m.88197 type:complete len:360 (+) Transcript_30416:147-1226(+)